MATDTSNSLRDLFEAALALPAPERSAFLAARCPDRDLLEHLQRLLAADAEPGEPLQEHVVSALASVIGDDDVGEAWQPGQRIGPFELLEILGEGGSATVFRAARDLDGVPQQVALKLLRRGLYSAEARRLFRRERLALASMSHPNIAHLIDGGVTEAGSAYLAMEFVNGVAITRYCADRRLDVRQRLRLLVVACRAVAAAHRNLIVHRDLKPSNIMVSVEGQVKLLDFGIAKLLDPDQDDATGTGLAALTPAYAAPEQLRDGPISTATDVYALGVLLHELLLGARPGRHVTTGQRPSSHVDAEAARAVGQPLPSAALRNALRGDLDNILLKALADEPERRYASAAELGDDLERHLGARPVEAHPDSRWYRSRKFVQRHRGGVTLTVAFAIGLIASLGVALWQATVAREQARIAHHEAARANAVRDFVVSVFDAARASLPRDMSATPQILAVQAQGRLAAMADIDAVTRADMQRTLGEVWLSLSNFDAAERSFRQAQDLAAGLGDPALVRSLRVSRADGWQRAGRDAEAVNAIEPVLAELRVDPSPITLRALHVLAAAQIVIGDPEVALALQREAAALAADLYPRDDIQALAADLEVGNALATLQRYPEAIATLTPLLERWRLAHPEEDYRYVRALGNLIGSKDGRGDSEGVEGHLRELLAIKQRIYPAAHDAIAKTLRDLAQVVAITADRAQAEALFNQALTMQREVLGDDHREVVATLDGLGVLMVNQRRFDEADHYYQTAIAICLRAAIKDEVCPRVRNNLGQSYYRRNRLDDAEREMRTALAERRRLFGDDHPTVAYSLSTLANVAASQGDHDRSMQLSLQALTQLERIGHGGAREATLIRNGYAQSLFLLGRNEEALTEIERTLGEWRQRAPDSHVRQVMILALKAQILKTLDRPADMLASIDTVLALGVPADQLSARTKQLLRETSGRSDVYPEAVTAGETSR